jgi:pyocin large subunit-like protein
MTNSALSTQHSAVELSADERVVMDVLDRCQGRQHAISLTALAEATELHWRTVQDVIAHLIEYHQQPIGSATGKPHGYFLITTEEEQRQAEAQLRHRIIALAKRLAHLKKNTPAEILAQLSLLTEEATYSGDRRSQ